MKHFAGVLKTFPPKNLGGNSDQLCSLVTKDSTIHRMKNQICNTFPAQCQNANAKMQMPRRQQICYYIVQICVQI